MKKTIAMLAVAALALSLVACGGSPAASASTAAPAASSAPASSAAASSTPAESTPAESTPAAADNELGLTEAYMGMTGANEAVFLGFNADWTLAVFVALSGNGEYASFVGAAVDNGDGTVTITDETNELTLTFGVTELEGGNLELDMGDLGKAEVGACEVQEVIDAISQIDEAGTAVA